MIIDDYEPDSLFRTEFFFLEIVLQMLMMIKPTPGFQSEPHGRDNNVQLLADRLLISSKNIVDTEYFDERMEDELLHERRIPPMAERASFRVPKER